MRNFSLFTWVIGLWIATGCTATSNNQDTDESDTDTDADTDTDTDTDTDADGDTDTDADGDTDTDADGDTDTDADGDTDTDADGDTDTDADTDTDTDGDCSTLDVDTCLTRTDCVTINGRDMIQLPDGEYCVDWDNPTIPLGCMDAKMGCGDAITIAGAPGTSNDGCYWFPQTCIPTDWEVCSIGYVECE